MLLNYFCQVSGYDWKDGPDNLHDLFDWANYNATMLLKEHKNSEDIVRRASENIQRDIFITDSYSGTGTGSTTLRIQWTSILRQVLTSYYKTSTNKIQATTPSYSSNSVMS